MRPDTLPHVDALQSMLTRKAVCTQEHDKRGRQECVDTVLWNLNVAPAALPASPSDDRYVSPCIHTEVFSNINMPFSEGFYLPLVQELSGL